MTTETIKKGVLVALLGVLAVLVVSPGAATAADSVAVGNSVLGSGTPGAAGSTEATPVMDGMYHAPQYMPGSPTAATIYPRVVDVNCTKVGGMVKCDGYDWSPDMGRAEYLMIRPKMAPAPKVVYKPVIIYKEVPVKKVNE